MIRVLIMIIIGMFISIAVVVGIFYAIKYFIKYNAGLKRRKGQEQEELDRMELDDL